MNISIKFFYKIYLLPIFFYLIIFLVVFNKVFFNDNHFISHDNFIQFFVSFKNSTLWESDLGYGFPVFADPQWQLFYPFLYFFPKNLRGFDFYLLHFFIIGAYFTYLFSFYLTKNYLASLVSGLVFALSGSMIGQMSIMSVPAASSFWDFYISHYFDYINFYKIHFSENSKGIIK